MRGLTVAVGAVVVVVVVAAVYLHRGETDSETGLPGSKPPPHAASKGQAASQAASKGAERSSRVEERLSQLREDFDHRQAGAEPMKREVPAVAPDKRKVVEPKDQEADDDADDDDPEEMDQLKHTLLTDPDPDERIGAVLMLTGDEGPESLSILLEAMGDPNAEVRLAVVEALGDRAEELSPDTLNPALKDTDAEVRFEAVSILGDMEGNPQALQMVQAALNDPDPDVSELAKGIAEMSDQGEPGQQPAQPQNAQPKAHM